MKKALAFLVIIALPTLAQVPKPGSGGGTGGGGSGTVSGTIGAAGCFSATTTIGDCSADTGILIAGGAIGVDTSVVVFYSTGAGAPSANCTAGQSIYLDTTNTRFYRCSATNTWTEVSRISSGSGAPASGACDAAAEVGTLYYRTDNTSAASPLYACGQTGSGTYGWVLGGGGITASSTDTLTNKTLDAEGTGNVITITAQPFIPFATCQNTSATLAWQHNASPPAANCYGTNAVKGVADFDAAADEALHDYVALPDDFTGTVDVSLYAFANATTGTARVGINIDCIATTEDHDPAVTNATTFNFTPNGTANRLVITTQTGVTVTGCAAGELARIRFYRDADGTSGTDDMTGDLRVLGIRLKTRRAM